MYSVMIVDDEPEVREAIRDRTAWEACGFRLAGDYGNGLDALEAAAAIRPDVIITDISMPYMDGLELARRLADQYCDAKIVFLTGYDQFEYAQEAVRLKAKDFLLKPINAEELEQFLRGLKRELDEEMSRRQDLERLRWQLHESLPVLRERLLQRLVSTGKGCAEVLARLESCHIRLPGPAYVVMAADPDIPEDRDPELMRFAVRNIVEEIAGNVPDTVVFQNRDDQIVVLMSGDERQIAREIMRRAEQACHSVGKYLKFPLSVGIGRVCAKPECLHIGYREALNALDYRFLLGSGNVIFIGDLEQGRGRERFPYAEWERQLLLALKACRMAEVSARLEEWESAVCRREQSLDDGQGAIYKLLVALMRVAEDLGISEDEVFGRQPFALAATFKSVREARRWLEAVCARMIEWMSDRRKSAARAQMLQAEAYIQAHYDKPDLSLSEVCQHVYMSTSYFSTQFKQHTGETFVEYLTRIRMEKAKELLRLSPLKTYEVAARVGYEDPRYFSVLFRRVVGKSPKEYRAENHASVH